jgi:ElaB/YqjD/DUF883 family membrane-anchored ribosome-binding protein
MENETEMIREQMLETRTALTEKLENLEEQVTAKVKGTTDSIAETVESVKEAVENTAHTVERTFENTVESVKDTFDLSRHFEEHPWVMLGGAVLVGFIGGRILDRATAPPQMTANGISPEPRYETAPSSYQAASSRTEPGWGAEVVHALRPAMAKLGQLAIGVTTGIIGEMVREQLPDTLKKDVGEAIDDITVALGGKPLHGFMAQEESTNRQSAGLESSTRQIP